MITIASSRTSGAGELAITRRRRGRWGEASMGARRVIRLRAWMVVQGVSCPGGRVPARASARAWAKWLGHGSGGAAGGGSGDGTFSAESL